MEPKLGFTLQQLWANSESAIAQKTSSYEVRDSDIRRAGTPAARMVPPQTGSLAQRAIEEWELKPARKQSRRNSGTDAGWKTSSDQERRRRNAHCHRARPALSGGKSFGGSPQCLHPSHHQNHARQAEPPSHCANDHRRSRRGPYTLRESSQLLRGHSHRGVVTRHTAQPSTQFQ